MDDALQALQVHVMVGSGMDAPEYKREASGTGRPSGRPATREMARDLTKSSGAAHQVEAAARRVPGGHGVEPVGC